ncbi:glucoamylase (plasmid) [Cellulomonas sp. WB94]|uniref:glycoside hydrolase family 15 protein n=1 Tax=Cellulomonas sp. WB94 TaxID=2173174 RepID=UPI000D567823|nr:glycoside hydrolase family 15 protein [Cellulomonas sp. WB94]PVU81289.1 glucoamylase [Cellulomonas sp. WB94]
MANDETVPIGEYAVLGDGRTAALVSRRGSVDWLCLPRFDSAACFASLLGTAKNGRWLLTVPDATRVERSYLDDSFVLRTVYTTPGGTAVVEDAMPLADGRADLVRRITCTEGTVAVEHEWVVRFGYGAIVPWLHRVVDADGREALRAIAGPDSLVLRGDRLPHAAGHRHHDEFELHAGESVELVCTWVSSWEPTPAPLPIRDRLAETATAWSAWADGCPYTGSYRDKVVRSLLVLSVLTSSETGGIVAAATTSLPEDFGGERNWDYRYCWLRDAALTIHALLEHGFRDESTAWRDWLLRAVAGDPRDLQIMYGVDGRRDLPERTLDHLPGYAGSLPVRLGNAAVGQVQNDVLGEVMCALHAARRAGLAESDDSWSLQRRLVNHLARHWRTPDRGIWEVRGAPRHFTHSKIMAWAALDRAVLGIEEHGLDGPIDLWRSERDAIRADVLAHGWDPEQRTFVQSYGAKHTDAALLQLVQVGFLPPGDDRVTGTIAAIRRELEVAPGLVHRYLPERTDDGVAGTEHPFLACSFWLADALSRRDELEEATAVLDVLTGLTNDVGLLAEQYDPRTGQMAGNFPQALSHLALVRAVHSHDEAVARRLCAQASTLGRS